MQNFRGEIRVNDSIYQAFVNPVFLPPEDGSIPCPPDWDDTAASSSPPPCQNLSQDRLLHVPFRTYSPRLFIDTASSLSSFQDVLLLSEQQQQHPPSDDPGPPPPSSSRDPTPSRAASPSGGPSPSASSSTSHPSSSPSPSSDFPFGSTQSSSADPAGTGGDRFSSSPTDLPPESAALPLPVPQYEQLERALRQFLKTTTDHSLSETCTTRSATQTVIALRYALSHCQTLFCRVDGFAVTERLYIAVAQDIRTLVASAHQADVTASIEGCWAHPQLLQYLISKHVPRILESSPPAAAAAVSAPLTPPQSAAANGVDNTDLEDRSVWRRVRAAAIQQQPQQQEPQQKSLPRGEERPRGDAGLEQPSSFSRLCRSYEALRAQVHAIASWKQAAEDLYRLRDDGDRVALEAADRVLQEGRQLQHHCDINHDLSRLEADVSACRDFGDAVRRELPSLFKSPQPTPRRGSSSVPAVPRADIEALKPFARTYSALLFSVREGERLMNALREAVSWQTLVAEAMGGKDLDRCKELVEAYDGAKSGLNMQCVASLRDDVTAGEWLRRLERLLTGKKPLTLSQIADILSSSHGMAMARRFRDHRETREFIQQCSVVESWLRTALSPPYARLCSTADRTDFISALSTISVYHLVDGDDNHTAAVMANAVENDNAQQPKGLHDVKPEEDPTNDRLSQPSPNWDAVMIADESPGSRPSDRVDEAALEAFCTACQGARIMIPGSRVFESVRLRLLKWKKRQKRAVNSHGAVTVTECETILKEGLALVGRLDVDVLVAELEAAIQRHAEWVVAVDAFLASTRHVLAEGEIARASSNGLLSLETFRPHNNGGSHNNDGEQQCPSGSSLAAGPGGKRPSSPFQVILRDVLHVLDDPPDCPRPSLDDLARLMSQYSEDPIIDSDRSRLLQQIQDHAERWKRRVRDCLKTGRTPSAAIDRLKLQLLIEAKYFCIDLAAEEKLAGPFYLQLWRQQVASLAASSSPLDEEEVLNLAGLPDRKQFRHLLDTKKPLRRKPPKPNEDERMEPDDNNKFCSSLEVHAHQMLYSVPESEALSVLLECRADWMARHETHRKTQPPLSAEEWTAFLDAMDMAQPIRLESVLRAVAEVLRNAEVWGRELTAMCQQRWEASAEPGPVRAIGGATVGRLREIQAALEGCPVRIPEWDTTGKSLLAAAETLESQAAELCRQTWTPEILDRVRAFIDCRAHDAPMALDLPALESMGSLRRRLEACDAWEQGLARMRKEGSSAPLSMWEAHLEHTTTLRFVSPGVEGLQRQVQESQLWAGLFQSYREDGRVPLAVSECMVGQTDFGLGVAEEKFAKISAEVHLCRTRLVPQRQMLLQKVKQQTEGRDLLRVIRDASIDQLRDFIRVTCDLQSLVSDLHNLHTVRVPYHDLEEEIRMRRLGLKVVCALQCLMPHAGCPYRPLEPGDPEPCYSLVPLAAGKALLQEIQQFNIQTTRGTPTDTSVEGQQEQQHKPAADDDDVNMRSEHDHPLVDQVRHAAATTREEENGVASSWSSPQMDSDLCAIFAIRVQEAETWMDRYTTLCEGASLPALRAADDDPFVWPDVSDPIWDMWSAPRGSAGMLIQSPPGTLCSTIGPNDWDTRWQRWLLPLGGTTNDDGGNDSRHQGSIKTPPSRPFKPGPHRKIVGSTATAEFCDGTLGLKVSQVLCDPLLPRFTGGFKCPKNIRVTLGSMVTSSFNCDTRYDETCRRAFTPIIVDRLGVATHCAEEWSYFADRWGGDGSAALQKTVICRPTLRDALELLNEATRIAFAIQVPVEVLRQAIVTEALWLCMVQQWARIPGVRWSGLVELKPEDPFSSPHCGTLGVEALIRAPACSPGLTTPDALTRLIAQCELLPFQVPMKCILAEQLQAAVGLALAAREAFLFLPRGTLVGRFFKNRVVETTPSPAAWWHQAAATAVHDALQKYLLGDTTGNATRPQLPSPTSSSVMESGRASSPLDGLAQQLAEHEAVCSGDYPETSSEQTLRRTIEGLKFVEVDVGLCGICASHEPSGLSVDGGPPGPWLRCDDCGRWLHMHCIGVPSDIVSCFQRLESDDLGSYRFTCPICLARAGRKSAVELLLSQSRWYRLWADPRAERELPSVLTLLSLVQSEEEAVVAVRHEGYPLEHRVAILCGWLLDVALTVLGLPVSKLPRRREPTGAGEDLYGAAGPKTPGPEKGEVSTIRSGGIIGEDDVAAGAAAGIGSTSRGPRRTTRSNTGSLRARSVKSLLTGRRPQSASTTSNSPDGGTTTKTTKRRGRGGARRGGPQRPSATTPPQQQQQQVTTGSSSATTEAALERLLQTPDDAPFAFCLPGVGDDGAATTTTTTTTMSSPNGNSSGTCLTDDDPSKWRDPSSHPAPETATTTVVVSISSKGALELVARMGAIEPDAILSNDNQIVAFCRAFIDHCTVAVSSSSEVIDETSVSNNHIQLLPAKPMARLECIMPSGRTVTLNRGVGVPERRHSDAVKTTAVDNSPPRSTTYALASLIFVAAFTGVSPDDIPILSALIMLLTKHADLDRVLMNVKDQLLQKEDGEGSTTTTVAGAAQFMKVLLSDETSRIRALLAPHAATELPERFMRLCATYTGGCTLFVSPLIDDVRALLHNDARWMRHWVSHIEAAPLARPMDPNVDATVKLFEDVRPFIDDPRLLAASRAYLELVQWVKTAQAALHHPPQQQRLKQQQQRRSVSELRALADQGRQLCVAAAETAKEAIEHLALTPHKRTSAAVPTASGGTTDSVAKRLKRDDGTVAIISPPEPPQVKHQSKEGPVKPSLSLEELVTQLAALVETLENYERQTAAVVAVSRGDCTADLPDSVTAALNSMSPAPVPPARIAYAAVAALADGIRTSSVPIDGAGDLYRVHEAWKEIHDTLMAGMEDHARDRKQLPWDTYASLAAVLDTTACCCFGTATTWFRSVHHAVSVWTGMVRGVLCPTTPGRAPDQLSQAVALKKATTGLAVDVSRSPLYSDLRRLIRDLRRQQLVLRGATNNTNNQPLQHPPPAALSEKQQDAPPTVTTAFPPPHRVPDQMVDCTRHMSIWPPPPSATGHHHATAAAVARYPPPPFSDVPGPPPYPPTAAAFSFPHNGAAPVDVDSLRSAANYAFPLFTAVPFASAVSAGSPLLLPSGTTNGIANPAAASSGAAPPPDSAAVYAAGSPAPQAP